MKSKLEKVSSFEWAIFVIIGSAILATFMISQIKVYSIKGKVESAFVQKIVHNKKKVKKPLS